MNLTTLKSREWDKLVLTVKGIWEDESFDRYDDPDEVKREAIINYLDQNLFEFSSYEPKFPISKKVKNELETKLS